MTNRRLSWCSCTCFWVLTILFQSFSIQAQVWTGDLYLETQASIDNFAASLVANGQAPITKIEGSLFIGSPVIDVFSDVADLSFLAELDTVTDMLELHGTILTDLTAFSNLKHVDYLYIWDNDELLNLEGLNNLTINKTESNLTLRGNKRIKNLTGLEGIEGLGHLQIYFNDSLHNIDALGNLRYIFPVGGSSLDYPGLYLEGNDITSINNWVFDSCRYLNLREAKLKAINQLEAKKWSGNLGLNCKVLTNIDGFKLDTVVNWNEMGSTGVNLIAFGCDSLKYLKGISFDATRVKLEIYDNLSLDSIAGTSKCKRGSFVFKNNASLKYLDLSSLLGGTNSMYELIDIQDNFSLERIWLDSLKYWGPIIKNNPNLIEIMPGANQFEKGSVNLVNCPRLKRLGVFQSLKRTLGETLIIDQCDSLETVDFFRLRGDDCPTCVIKISHAQRITGFDSLLTYSHLDLSADLIDGFNNFDNGQYITLSCDTLSGFAYLDTLVQYHQLYLKQCDTITPIFGQNIRVLDDLWLLNLDAPLPLFPNLDTASRMLRLQVQYKNPDSLDRLNQFRLKDLGLGYGPEETFFPTNWHPAYMPDGSLYSDFVFAIVSVNMLDISYINTIDSFYLIAIRLDSIVSLDGIIDSVWTDRIQLLQNPLLTDCDAVCHLVNAYPTATIGTFQQNGLNCNYPKILTITCDTTVATVDVFFNEAQNHLLVYPNPSTDQDVTVVTVLNKPLPAGLLSIHDMQGQTLYEKTLLSPEMGVTIPITNLPQGIYFIRMVSSDERIWISKLVVK
jgi:Secretion system C-terminal sorting domain